MLGATHPHLVRAEGERYRLSLDRLAEPLGDIQVMYAGRPTLMLRVLQVLAAGSAPRSRGEIADALNVYPGEVGRALGELRRRGYGERVDHGRYGLTRAWAEARFATDDSKHRARTSS